MENVDEKVDEVDQHVDEVDKKVDEVDRKLTSICRPSGDHLASISRPSRGDFGATPTTGEM